MVNLILKEAFHVFLQRQRHCKHNFAKLNICHFSEHLTNLSTSFCKCCLSPSLVTLLNTFVSFANFSTLLVILSSKTLLYIKNNIDHFGTPLKTDFQFKTSPSTTTSCLLSVSHYSIQSIMPSRIPRNLSNNL